MAEELCGQFYEVVICLPSDVEQHLESISDYLLHWLDATIFILPEEAVWDIQAVNLQGTALVGTICSVVWQNWVRLAGQGALPLYQLQEGSEYFCLHCWNPGLWGLLFSTVTWSK